MSNIVELEKARGKVHPELLTDKIKTVLIPEQDTSSAPVPDNGTLKRVDNTTEVILAELRSIRKKVEQAEKERTLMEAAGKRKQFKQEKKEKAPFSPTQKDQDNSEPVQTDSNDQKEASPDSPFNLISNKLKELKFEETESHSPDTITKENTPDPDQQKAA